MPAPIIGAAAIAARLVARKIAKDSAKKAVKKRIQKNIVTKGGKAGRAIENKMRSEMKLPKLTTTGKTKAVAKATPQKVGRYAGSVNLSSKGKVAEYMSDAKVKGKARNIRDTAQRAELEAKGYSKRASLPKFPSKKIMGNKDKLTTSKVPVKKKSK